MKQTMCNYTGWIHEGWLGNRGTKNNNIFYFYFVFWGVQKDNSSLKNCLPEFDIKAGFSKFAGFCKRVGSISRYFTSNFSFASICTTEDPIADKPMDYTLESKDEVIRKGKSELSKSEETKMYYFLFGQDSKRKSIRIIWKQYNQAHQK